MKTGKTLQELAMEIERQSQAKKDYIAPTQTMEIVPLEKNIQLGITNGEKQYYGITDYAHNQIADRIGIPRQYYKRMQDESPELLATNINHWFQSNPSRQMVRTLDHNVRAFLSDRYRRIDNYELLESILPVVSELRDVQIVSSQVTDTRMYLKVLLPKIQHEIKVNDIVQAGFVFSNSEIGAGSVKVEPLVYRLVCSNGMISADHSIRKYHVGRKTGGNDSEAYELFSDETIQADDRALMLKVRDTIKAVADETKFRMIAEKMTESTEKVITASPTDAVEVLSNKMNFSNGEKDSILKHLCMGGDFSQYGILNAVTRASQDIDSYDRATELERAGGQILTLSKKDWNEIAEAA